MTVAGLTTQRLKDGESYWLAEAVKRLQKPTVLEAQVVAALNRARDFYDEEDKREGNRVEMPRRKTRKLGRQTWLEGVASRPLQASHDAACALGRMALPCLIARTLEPLPDSEVNDLWIYVAVGVNEDGSQRTQARLSAALEAIEESSSSRIFRHLRRLGDHAREVQVVRRSEGRRPVRGPKPTFTKRPRALPVHSRCTKRVSLGRIQDRPVEGREDRNRQCWSVFSHSRHHPVSLHEKL